MIPENIQSSINYIVKNWNDNLYIESTDISDLIENVEDEIESIEDEEQQGDLEKLLEDLYELKEKAEDFEGLFSSITDVINKYESH